MAYGDDPYGEEEDAPVAAPPPPPTDQVGVIVPGAPGPGGPMTANAPGGGGGGKNKGGGPPDLGPQYNYPGLPGFVAPQFAAPTFEMAQAEPGYQFRLDAGRGALERSAAARGVLRSGGTLQGLQEYGQKFGAQEYQNVYNRALQSFDRRYQGAKDTYAPQLARWQTMAQGEIQRALAQYANKNKGGGGGGGGQQYIPPDILGPPPTPPDYAQMQVAGSYAPPPNAYAPNDDEYLPY